jgi:hypothetical protein
MEPTAVEVAACRHMLDVLEVTRWGAVTADGERREGTLADGIALVLDYARGYVASLQPWDASQPLPRDATVDQVLQRFTYKSSIFDTPLVGRERDAEILRELAAERAADPGKPLAADATDQQIYSWYADVVGMGIAGTDGDEVTPDMAVVLTARSYAAARVEEARQGYEQLAGIDRAQGTMLHTALTATRLEVDRLREAMASALEDLRNDTHASDHAIYAMDTLRSALRGTA